MKCPMCGKRAWGLAGRWRCRGCGISGYYSRGRDGVLAMLIADWTAGRGGLEKEKTLEYCAVRFSEGGRPYSYLTGGLHPRPGDTVTVPVGKNNTLKAAEVVSVGKFTRNNAPYPPEMTKTINSVEKRGAPVKRLLDMLKRREDDDV